MPSDDQRIYSDAEFALILSKAAEEPRQTNVRSSSNDGVTLDEMKAAAEEAGIDPARIESAARMLIDQTKISVFERLIGGPLRHERDVQFRVELDDDSAARVLAAVRMNAHYHSASSGEASSLGIMWKASGNGNVLSVVARPSSDGTSVSVVLDRRGTFVLTGTLIFVALSVSLIVAKGIGSVVPSLVPWVPLVGIGSLLALARNFWVSSSRKSQQLIGDIIDTVGHTLVQSESKRILTTALQTEPGAETRDASEQS